MTEAKEISSGVQEFIDKLKNLGVNEGQKLAEEIIKEARSKASDILSQAQLEADTLLSDARQKLEVERKSSHEAIKLAFRDTEIALRSRVWEAFSTHLRKLVSFELEDRNFLKQLVLAIAGIKTHEITQTRSAEILLPAKIFENEEEGALLTEETKNRLRHLVLGISNDMLLEGIELKPSIEIKGGLKVRLIGKEIELDLTDEALANLILKYLLPRYKEIVSGQE